MNPFGNRDEPVAPSWYLPQRPKPWRQVCWYARNPLHNFTHYMVGWAGRPFTVTRSRADIDGDGFADSGGWLFCTLKLGSARRPYVSYISPTTEFMVGWHPTRGKLGFRFTRH